MKRTFLFFLVMIFAGANIFAQSVLYQDDFESYTVGGYLAVQSPDWTTWSNDPGSSEDAFISDDYAFSGSNSVKVADLTDLVLPLGDKQNGKFEISFMYYVEAGYGGYYNLQHYEAVGTEWAVEVFFGSDGSGEIMADGSTIPFTYSVGQWTDIQNVVDMDADEASIYINGMLEHTWTWSTLASGGAGANQLGALNIWAGAMTGDDPLYYMDDVVYEQIFEAEYDDDFESYNLNDFIAVVNPEWWKTWSDDPGSSEDGPIVDEQAYSGDQSLKVTGITDLIFLLGDKTAGQFDVNWMYYVPIGYEGYYNFQHMEAPGTEWAIEVWFYLDGTGEVKVDGGSVAFTFDHNTWMELDHNINLDDDVAEMSLNGTPVHTWTWSTISQGGPGTNQLGSVNFYAGASTGQDPLYYVDDVFYMQSGGATDPALELSQTMFEDTIGQGTTEDRMLSIDNVGGADLNYNISVVYAVTDKKTVNLSTPVSFISGKGNEEFAMNTAKPGGAPEPTEDVTIHYDGDNTGNSVGLTNPGEWRGAAKFPASMMNQYAGMELSEVMVYLASPTDGDDISVQIYGMGLDYAPGELIVEEFFSSFTYPDWNYMNFASPIPITGEDIWVSIYLNQTQTESFPLGIDGDPTGYNINGDWFSTGPGWGHVTDNPDIDGNWNIRAILTGDPIEGWLSVSPENGTVAAGDFDDVTVTYDATNLLIGEYHADLVFVTNAPESQFVEVPVTLTVVDATGIGDEDMSRIEMLVYPNPARNMVNVQSNTTIERLSIYNHIGQSVAEQHVNNTSATINVDGIESGVYIIRIETTNGYTTQKLVIE